MTEPTFENALYWLTATSLPYQVYPNVLPQDAPLPAITFLVVASNSLKSLVGSIGVIEAMVQFTAYSYVLKDVELMIEQLRKTWEGYCSAFDGDIQGVTITAAYVNEAPVQFEYLEAGDDEVTFQGSLDIGINYWET